MRTIILATMLMALSACSSRHASAILRGMGEGLQQPSHHSGPTTRNCQVYNYGYGSYSETCY